MNTNTKEYKDLQILGKSLIGKKCQSNILTYCNEIGGKSILPQSEITGFEIVEWDKKPTIMLEIEGDSVFYDTCFNFSK